MDYCRNDIFKILFGLIFYYSLYFQLNAQNKTFIYSDSWGKDGVEIISSDSKSLILNFSIKQFYVTDTVINGQKLQHINLGGIFLPNEAGAPNLPKVSKIIAIPQDSKPLIKVISYRTEIYQNYTIIPAPEIPLETKNTPLKYIKNKEIYGLNKNYPSEFITYSDPMQLRNVDCFIIGICPFQFNPVTKEMIVYRDIKIEINFKGGNGHIGNDAYRSRWFDPILEDAIFNYSALPEIDYNARYDGKSVLTGYEYVIISPTDPEFIQWADSLKNFRTEQGIITTVIPLSEIPNGNTPNGIGSWIKNAYNTWNIKPVAILLLGDYGTSISNSIISPIYYYDDLNCVSDNMYADINNDQLPDIIISRLPAMDEAQLRTMVSKCINYERTPPLDRMFYDNPITSMGWQTERWYQLCVETVGGFWKYRLNKNPIRINSLIAGKLGTDPWSTASNTEMLVSLFGKNNLNYIPNTPQELGGFDGGNSLDIVNAVNSGAFMLLHRDHGSVDEWSNPKFKNYNISELSNKDLSFILSIDCSTGKFNDNNECIAEKFLRYSDENENMGALGIIAASGLSYSFLNDVYLWGMIDNFWPEFLSDQGFNSPDRSILPAFGNVAGKYFLKQTDWLPKSFVTDATFNLFHMFGDAFQMIYSEVPKNLNVSHNPFLIAGANHFDVKADSGSLIVITANGQIIATATGTGFPLSIPIPAQNIQTKVVITVTKCNYIRYRNEIETMNLDGPYFILISNVVSDPLPYGNNNGLIDFGETNYLNFKIKNIGVDAAKDFSIEMNTSDKFIILEKNKLTIDVLPTDSIVSFINCFKYIIADNIPDKHKIKFIISIKAGNEIWNFEINKIANAPELNIGDLIFSDKLPGGNNNGIIDVYETIEFVISSTNSGHSDIEDLTGTLTCSDPNIIIENNCFFAKLKTEETSNAKFIIRIKENVSEAPIIFNYKLYSANYQAQKDFIKTANIYYEDWETNNFNKMPWKESGDKNWYIISGSEKYEGYFSAKSGKISDNEESNLDITFTSAENDTIYFYKKVSSDPYDYLKFFIDDLKFPVSYWSGINNKWTLEKYPVKAGTHLYRWQYVKNWRIIEGSDCAWIDCIVFPKSAETTRFKKIFADNIECFPNPFIHSTTISYSLENESIVSIFLYNSLGKKVSTIINNELAPIGYHQMLFNKESLLPGLYYLIININSNIITKKMIITNEF